MDLPAGSARKRRLMVLHVGAQAVAGTTLKCGDRLIVEPGAHANRGRLLACRCENRLVLRRVRLDARGESLLAATDPHLLPLPDASACHVVGTVLAAVRMRDDGRASVAFPPDYSFGAYQLHLVVGERRAIDVTVRCANALVLEQALKALETPIADRSAAGREVAAAATRLRTLGNCLQAVSDERIYRALAREINIIILRLRRTLATRRHWTPLQGSLRPLNPSVIGRSRVQTPDPQATRAGRSRTLRSLADGAPAFLRREYENPRYRETVTHSAKAELVDTFGFGMF